VAGRASARMEGRERQKKEDENGTKMKKRLGNRS
jgi:hypothetical protein